jgi:hypothetical protein
MAGRILSHLVRVAATGVGVARRITGTAQVDRAPGARQVGAVRTLVW